MPVWRLPGPAACARPPPPGPLPHTLTACLGCAAICRCFIGQRRLDLALEGLPGVEADKEWHAFLLDPHFKQEGGRGAGLGRHCNVFAGHFQACRLQNSLQNQTGGHHNIHSVTYHFSPPTGCLQGSPSK